MSYKLHMALTNDNPRDLHLNAAREHEETAQFHRDAALCHDENRISSALQYAHSALSGSAKAHERSTLARETSHCHEKQGKPVS